MIIGLLEAETLPTHIADRFGRYGDMFADLLQGLEPTPNFRYYAADQGELPDDTNECDAYIVTGSRHNAYDDHDWIMELRHFITQLHGQHQRCLGICFGHQVIAQALGGQAAKSEKGWGIGAANFTVCNRPPWMTDETTRFAILVSHQDQVAELPPDASRFACSDFCPNGGYFIGEHIFCLQGHPEFRRDYVEFLINKRRRLIGECGAARALDSLDLPVERTLFRSWIADFLGMGINKTAVDMVPSPSDGK